MRFIPHLPTEFNTPQEGVGFICQLLTYIEKCVKISQITF